MPLYIKLSKNLGAAYIFGATREYALILIYNSGVQVKVKMPEIPVGEVRSINKQSPYGN